MTIIHLVQQSFQKLLSSVLKKIKVTTGIVCLDLLRFGLIFTHLTKSISNYFLGFGVFFPPVFPPPRFNKFVLF